MSMYMSAEKGVPSSTLSQRIAIRLSSIMTFATGKLFLEGYERSQRSQWDTYLALITILITHRTMSITINAVRFHLKAENTHLEMERESAKDIWVKQTVGRRAGWTTSSVKLNREACNQGNKRIFQAPPKKDRNRSPQRTQSKKSRCQSVFG